VDRLWSLVGALPVGLVGVGAYMGIKRAWVVAEARHVFVVADDAEVLPSKST
jgi:hypothetical protein